MGDIHNHRFYRAIRLVERARQFAQIIACDIQPLTNLRVLAYLRTVFNADTRARSHWFRHWLLEGLDALEHLLVAGRGSTSFCVGNEVSLADIVLVPQMYQARKFKLAVDDFSRLCEIEAACLEIDGFRDVAPIN